MTMALVRWNPWGELFNLHTQMDQLFQSMNPETEARNGADHYNLPVDIRQSDDAFTIEASVPGFAPADVEVTFENGVLTIKGTHSTEDESTAGGYVRRERRTGSMFRQIGLPAEVRSDDISAAFRNGVLTVTVPRAQKAQPKRITVTSESPPNATVVDGQSSNSEAARPA